MANVLILLLHLRAWLSSDSDTCHIHKRRHIVTYINQHTVSHPHSVIHSVTHTSSLHLVLMDVGQDPVVTLRHEIRVGLIWDGGYHFAMHFCLSLLLAIPGSQSGLC